MKRFNVPLRTLFTGLRAMNRNGLSLQLRLFVVLILFLFSVVLGLLLVLLFAGFFSAGLRESKRGIENELSHISKNVTDEFGMVAVEGVQLSERLSANIEKNLNLRGIAPGKLGGHPEILNGLLRDSFGILQSGLEKSRCSGSFIMLDATINPALPGSEFSRAGLYLKNLEPNIAGFPSIRFLRGPAIIAREQEMTLSLQWRQELPAPEGGFFSRVTETARGNPLPLSRLYFWNPRNTLDGDYEQVMILGVPMRTGDGIILGICGYDVSAMLFKSKYTPDTSVFTHAFAMLVPINPDGKLDASGALFAGGYAGSSSLEGPLAVLPDTVNTYQSGSGALYAGLHRILTLYPQGSAFGDQQWAVSILMPRADFDMYLASGNKKMILLTALLMLAAVAAAALVSRRYIKPVVEGLNLLRAGKSTGIKKTRIPEIDDLLEYLASQDRKKKNAGQPAAQPGAPSFSMFKDFESGIRTLSPAERSVFNLYMEGYDAREITEILCLSINTIKTHNKRIYMKLNVTSRSELMVYVNMLREKKGMELVQRDE